MWERALQRCVQSMVASSSLNRVVSGGEAAMMHDRQHACVCVLCFFHVFLRERFTSKAIARSEVERFLLADSLPPPATNLGT